MALPPLAFFSARPAISREPAIGAVLLLLTLTMFPGGIAQQQGPLMRWLGGGPFAHDPDASAPAQGGGMGARP